MDSSPERRSEAISTSVWIPLDPFGSIWPWRVIATTRLCSWPAAEIRTICTSRSMRESGSGRSALQTQIQPSPSGAGTTASWPGTAAAPVGSVPLDSRSRTRKASVQMPMLPVIVRSGARATAGSGVGPSGRNRVGVGDGVGVASGIGVAKNETSKLGRCSRRGPITAAATIASPAPRTRSTPIRRPGRGPRGDEPPIRTGATA
jgi:hypothetical protein